MAKSTPLTEPQVMSALRERFAAPAWVFMEQVRNGTGFTRTTRTADAIAMSTWPSRGLDLHGFEVKVSRSDWKRELEQPAKAEEIFRFCDRWWLVVGSEELVQPGELPPTWGLLVPRGNGLLAKVEAPKLEAQPITKLFLASLLRNMHGATDSELNRLVEERIGERLEQAEKRAASRFESQLTNAKREAETLSKTIADFETASGLALNSWHAGRLGAAVKGILSGTQRYDAGNFRRTAEIAEELAKTARAAADELDSLTGERKAAANG